MCAGVLKTELNDYTEDCLEEEQYGFRRQRGCMDATFTLQQIMK
jgi:hypothetical protein